MIYLDTHVVVWAYAGETARFPEKVCKRIEQEELLISPVVLLELQYLKEIDRITVDSGILFKNLASAIGLGLCDLPLMRIVTEAMTQSWTRDPFDRMIAASALARDAGLITKDRSILDHCPNAFWE